MNEEWQSEWQSLLGQPAWQKIEARLKRDQAQAMDRLLILARASSDAAVRAEAMKIEQIEKMLAMPRDEAEKVPV